MKGSHLGPPKPPSRRTVPQHTFLSGASRWSKHPHSSGILPRNGQELCGVSDVDRLCGIRQESRVDPGSRSCLPILTAILAFGAEGDKYRYLVAKPGGTGSDSGSRSGPQGWWLVWGRSDNNNPNDRL